MLEKMKYKRRKKYIINNKYRKKRFSILTDGKTWGIVKIWLI